MTYKVCKVSTAATDVPGVYNVLFNGDDRFFRRIEIHLSRDLGDNVLDFIELYGLWCALVQFELAGHQRTCGNLKLVVSRGAVKRLLLSDSSKGELYETSNALRTQFFGLSGISVEKNKPWTRGDHQAFCVKWDGTPPPQPSVENPVFGKIYLTHHTLVEYLDETKGECKPENVFPRLARVVRDLNREVALPADVMRHKQRRHAGDQDGVRYLGSMAGWQLVTRPALDHTGLLAITVYQRQGY
ncbi:hypothetical protein [uncultured Pseudomonas sp.]|uniref:hypothetical protein n=1 Tax=uncultured Pseudomonas sp. TaxID=114707 RepID=UPI00258FD880|nr:hypothetical protein [uncultured Pseudomonas sp.]